MYDFEILKKQCTTTDFENFEKFYTEIVNLIGLDTLKKYMPCNIEILKTQYKNGNIHFNSNGKKNNRTA